MFKKISIVFFSTIFFFMNIFPSFAFVASSSVASPSEALPMEQYFETDSFDTFLEPGLSLLSDGPMDGYGSDFHYSANYTDENGAQHQIVLEYDDQHGIYSATAPGTYDFYRLNLYIHDIPSAGTYGFSCTINQANLDYQPTSTSIIYTVRQQNVQTGYPIVSIPASSFVNTGTSYRWNFNITIPALCDAIGLLMYIPNERQVDLGSCSYSFTFFENSGDDVNPNYPSSSAGQDSANLGNIADNTSQIVDGQDNIMDTIREQVQYITLQLEAFWNQLAAQFTNLFNKMNDQLSQLLNGIEDQTTEVTGAIDDVESEINQSTTEINQNIDQSTNQITNGYDNSSLNNSANRYHGADKELENAQSAAWNQGADRIEDFDFGEFDFSPGVMAALSYCGNWLQNVFVGISFFNLPITIGLTIVFALMIIGYYRYH